MANTCASKSAPTHQIRILWGVGRWAGCVLVSISERAGSGTLEKFSRRDRDPDCAKFESSCRFRGSNMNPKKKSRRYRASVSIQALDLAISRFTNSLASNPSLASECAPPRPPPRTDGEGETRLRVRGWGSPNSDDWRKSLALCLLCETTP